MEEEHQRLQTGGGQGDDAELQLMLQLVLWNLLLPDPQRERSSALQGVAECEEALQVVVLLQKTDDRRDRVHTRNECVDYCLAFYCLAALCLTVTHLCVYRRHGLDLKVEQSFMTLHPLDWGALKRKFLHNKHTGNTV